MKYPSEYIRALADKVDVAEDWFLERDWRVWTWAEYKAEAEMLREQRDALLEDYRTLSEKYRRETGLPIAMSRETGQLLTIAAAQETLKNMRQLYRGFFKRVGQSSID